MDTNLPLRSGISDLEWEARIDLAAAFRLVDMHGWSDLLATHLSARVPDTDDHFLINPFGMLFEEMGFRYFGPIDGHDLNELIKTLDTIKDIDRPVLLHVITKKGKGMSVAEKDPVKYHGVKANGKKNGSVRKEIKKVEVPSFQDVFGHLSCEIAENRKDVVCVTAAMREGTGLVSFEKKLLQ